MTEISCRVDGCIELVFCKGMCSYHYKKKSREETAQLIKESGLTCSIEGCKNLPLYEGGRRLCRSHQYRVVEYGDPNTVLKRENGTGHVNKHGYIHVNNKDGKRKFQHRIVMEQHLSRELLSNETVHHINGDRADNRIENLELWSSSQPPGQRVEDKVKWAKEILALYDKKD